MDRTSSAGARPGRPPGAVLYQPVVDLESGDLRGVEAALPSFGRLAEACAQLGAWQGGLGDVRLSVALAPAWLRSPGPPGAPGLAGAVADVLETSGIAPPRLELALSETVLLEAPPILGELRSLGVGLALDRFGLDSVALGALRAPYVDTLRLDSSLVAALSRPLDAPQFALALVEAAGVVARHLDLRLVADGVDTEAQRELLRDLGCALGRGRRFGGPVGAAEFVPPARSEDNER